MFRFLEKLFEGGEAPPELPAEEPPTVVRTEERPIRYVLSSCTQVYLGLAVVWERSDGTAGMYRIWRDEAEWNLISFTEEPVGKMLWDVYSEGSKCLRRVLLSRSTGWPSGFPSPETTIDEPDKSA